MGYMQHEISKEAHPIPRHMYMYMYMFIGTSFYAIDKSYQHPIKICPTYMTALHVRKPYTNISSNNG